MLKKYIFKDARFKKAKPDTWSYIGGIFSKDQKRVFYGIDEVKEADPETFEFLAAKTSQYFGKDKHNYYITTNVVSEREFRIKFPGIFNK